MKKAIQILLIVVLLSVLVLIIVFIFDPFGLRTKWIGSIINSYLSTEIEGYSPLDKNLDNSGGVDPEISEKGVPSGDKHPLLNEEQEKTLEDYGVDVTQLPASVSPGMEACFVEKLGRSRADEIVAGASPSAIEIFKARSCLGH